MSNELLRKVYYARRAPSKSNTRMVLQYVYICTVCWQLRFLKNCMLFQRGSRMQEKEYATAVMNTECALLNGG